jgi:hypothetical protein
MSVNKYIATNAATFATAVADMALSNVDYTTISIEQTAGAPGLGGDVLELASTVVIPPNFLGNLSKVLIIEGNGITIRPNTSAGLGTDIPLIKRNNPLDNKSCSIIFRNINFDCRGAAMTCVELYNATNVIFENCRFLNCKTGLILANINRATVTNCHAENVTFAGFIDKIATNVNNRCNDITYTNCTVKCQENVAAFVTGFTSYSTARVAYYECATLSLMIYGLYVNQPFMSTPNEINNVQIRNYTGFGVALSSDPAFQGALIYLYMSTGFAKIDGLYITSSGTSSMIVVEGNAYVVANYPNPHLYVENVPWLPQNAQFRTQGGIPSGVDCDITPIEDVMTWEFKEIYDGRNIFGAARWYTGLIPRHRYAEFFDESKIILSDSIFVNNKYI